MATAYATLEVIPTVRGITGNIERQISGQLTVAGQRAGLDAGSAITAGIGSANYESTGRTAGTRVGVGLKTTGQKAGRDAGSAITAGLRSADYAAAGRDAAGRFRKGLVAGGHSAGRDAGRAVADGVRSEDYEASGRSAADRIRSGLVSGLRGVGVGINVATRGLSLFVANASTIATGFGLAARLVRSFSAATFISALALRQVAATGLTRLAGALRLISAIASRVAGEIGQITSAFLVLQGVVRLASFMTNFAQKLAFMTVGAATAIGVVSGLGTAIGGALMSALSAGVMALGAFAGAAVGLAGPAIFALKIGMKGLSEAAGTFGEDWKEADEAFNKMVGQRMGPMLTAVRTLKQEMVDRFSAELTPAFQKIGVGIDQVRGKFGWMSVYTGQIGKGIVDSLTGPETIGAIQRMGDASGVFFQHLNKDNVGLGGLASGFVQFAAAAATTFQDSSKSANDFFLNLGNKLASITPEQIRGALSQFTQIFENVSNVAMPLFSLFRQMGQASAQGLAPGFVAVGGAIREATPGLVNMANIIMPALGEVMQRLAPLIPALVHAFTPWATTLATIAPPLATVLSHLAPLAPYLLMAATAFKVVGAAMLVWNAITFASSVAQGVFAAATGRSAMTLTGNTIALAAHRIALIAGAVAARAFGIAMNFATGPIGLIILGVVALGAALWAFFTKTETGKRLWEKIWPAIKNAVAVVWEWLQVAWDWILNAFQWLGDKAMWLWNAAIKPAFEGIGAVISWWWDNIVMRVFNAYKVAFEVAGAVAMWLWHNAIQPAFDGISAVISFWWDNVVMRVFGVYKTVFTTAAETVMWFYNSGIKPAFDLVGSVFEWFNTKVTEVKDWVVGKFTDVVTFVTGMPDKVRSATAGLWDGIKDSFRSAINWLISAWNNFSLGFDFEIPVINKRVQFTIDTPNLPLLAGGGVAGRTADGRLWGPGTPTSDSILGRDARGIPTALVSTDEGVVKASAMARGGAELVAALNRGWVPPLEMLRAMLPGLAGGGLVAGQDLARGEAGKRYQYGGVGDPSWDCSGIAGGVWAAAVGKNPRRRYFTTDSDFASLGWKPGLGGSGDISIGTNGRVGEAGHMATTVGTLNVESSSGDGVEAGPGAKGAADFAKKWHWPMSGDPGGALGSGTASGLGADGSGGLGSGTGGTSGGPSTSGGTSSSGSTSRPAGTAVPVWVDNFPASLTTSSTAADTAAANTTTPAASSGVNGTAEATGEQFDQAAAVSAAFTKFNGAIGKAGESWLTGQKSAIPGIGGHVEGMEKTVNNWQIVTADIAGAFDRVAREQKRQTAGK
ncbi:phage tail protein [Nocardia arizonensis]|uniref:phage tail protein n=1 Tax=Nocardia arizonensis TaxID=1141647 RepID=UPI0006D1376D|nr:hypothetical protein [Nocardia arizonensis]